MSLTLPTVDAAGLDLVALHELAGVDELDRDAVAAVAREQEHRDYDNGQEDQGAREDALPEIRTVLRAQPGPNCAHYMPLPRLTAHSHAGGGYAKSGSSA